MTDIGFYFELLKKRIPAMAVIFTLCAALGVALALTLPPRYSAGATLLVEGAQIPDALARLDQIAASEQLQVLQQRLMTRANLIDIAKKYNVFAGDQGLNPDDVVKLMREQTLIRTTSGRNSATIMTISFDALSPKVAANVVNEYVTLILAADVERRLGTAGGRVDFFAQQVTNLNEQLSRQSAEIVAFKEANNDALPESMEYRLDRQSTLQERLSLRASTLASLLDQKRRLEALGAADVADSTSISPVRQQLAAARANLSGMAGNLSETNPRLIRLRDRIKKLEAQLESEDSPDAEADLGGAASALQLQLASIDSEMNFINAENRRTENELEEVRSAIERTPKVAIYLAELEREFENTQSRYNEAVAARSKAQTSEIIEETAKGERITPLERAVVPSGPSSPNRKLIAGGGVFAGGAFAAIFFVLTELLNRTIRRPVDLVRGLGVQPLATIPFLELPGERRKRRFLTGFVVLLILAAIVAGLWVIHTQYLPLDLVFERIVERIGL